MKNLRYLLIILILVIPVINGCSKSRQDKAGSNSGNSNSRLNNISIDSKTLRPSNLKYEIDSSIVTHYAILNTSMGKIKIALFGEDAPKTVENFIGLAKNGTYNGVLFHRVAKKFLIQTGDPGTKSTSKKSEWGRGGKSIWNIEFEDEFNPRAPSYKSGYQKGVVAMANRGPNTNTSQFFICLEEAKYLEPKWTIFGKVAEGIDVVEKISQVEIEPGPFEPNDGIPVKPVKLYSVSIVKKN